MRLPDWQHFTAGAYFVRYLLGSPERHTNAVSFKTYIELLGIIVPGITRLGTMIMMGNRIVHRRSDQSVIQRQASHLSRRRTCKIWFGNPTMRSLLPNEDFYCQVRNQLRLHRYLRIAKIMCMTSWSLKVYLSELVGPGIHVVRFGTDETSWNESCNAWLSMLHASSSQQCQCHRRIVLLWLLPSKTVHRHKYLFQRQRARAWSHMS
ncbi:hypothetical protein F5Y15DRAFT_171091 [Xylariaceae sp. FL0016]|nr:hypothetical protein F5Y15DRAFT_171091 [Xylariaceae sp. FL0016]